MKKVLLIVAIAALSAGTAFTGSAIAQNRDRADRAAPTANQIVAEEDAHTARIKADLRLTPDQEKNWPGFESALHEIGQTRADRLVAPQADSTQPKADSTQPKADSAPPKAESVPPKAESAQQTDSGDVIEYLKREAKALGDRSADVKKLADAAQPLYASLDEHQKRRFANELIHLSRERDIER
jgi:type IV secretory pathway VirB10-like protein